MGRVARIRVVAFALAAFAALSSSACAPGEGGAGASEGVVYISLPLSGPAAAAGRDAADGAELALEQAGGEAGGVEVRAELLDDADRRGWDPVKVGANARTATEDAGAIAYIGELESGATRTSLPLTNEAGLLQVSPASAAMDLVREPGTLAEPPSSYALNAQRSFVRVVPGDVLQAEAAIGAAREAGLRRLGVLDDGSDFGEVMSEALIARAGETGFETERLRTDPIEARRADQGEGSGAASATYLAGTPDGFDAADLGPGRYVVPDSFIGPEGEPLAPAPPGSLATSAALYPEQLPMAGLEFVRDFRAAYDREPGRFAAYGYESMALVLDGIERSAEGGEVAREDLVAAVFATDERESVLGTYSIEDTGETTLDAIGVAELGDGVTRPLGAVGEDVEFRIERTGQPSVEIMLP